MRSGRVMGGRRRSPATAVLLACLPIMSPSCRSAPDPSLDERMPAGVAASRVDDLVADLRRIAELESGTSTGVVVRDIDFPGLLGVERLEREPAVGTEGPLETLLEEARRRLDLSVAPPTPSSEPLSVSRPATMLYLEGRNAVAEGRPLQAIPALAESVRIGGGTAALRALAEACDLAGRPRQAMEARLAQARRGTISPSERRRLVDGLATLGNHSTAIAVAAAGVVRGLDIEGDPDPSVAMRFAEVLHSAGEPAAAALIRACIAALDSDLPIRDRALECRFLVALGDDDAMAGRLESASNRWRQAAGLAVGDQGAIQRRRLQVEAALGRDGVIQQLLLDAADDANDDTLALASGWREEGVDLSMLARILEIQCLDGRPVGTNLRLLLAVDPERGARVLSTLGDSGRVAAVRPLVEAAFMVGVRSALDVAVAFDDSVDAMDAAVAALLSGPVDSNALLETASEVREDTGDGVVLAELFRRQARPDQAIAILGSMERSNDANRIAMLRAAADLADPLAVLAVDSMPFDVEVESARVRALLEAGEVELAETTVRELLERVPDAKSALAAGMAVLAMRREGAREAIELGASAILAGDRSLSTRVELATLVAGLEDRSTISRTVDQVLVGLPDDPGFRAILAAEEAMMRGDAGEAATRLEARLGTVEDRDLILVRLLAVWRAAGRLQEGRRRMASLEALHPADPSIGDAVFAIERSLAGPRDAAIRLRGSLGRSLDGLPDRRLEMVLSEIPESRGEWRRLVLRRLERSPAGPARDVQELAVVVEGGPGIDEVLERCEAIDPRTLTPRLRRRLASIAAAVPSGRGAAIVDRIAAVAIESGDPLDVDSAVAIATTLEDDLVQSVFTAVPPAPPSTIEDPDWQPRVGMLAARDLDAADAVAGFGLRRSPDRGEGAGLLRTAVAVSILANRSAKDILRRLDAAAAMGWQAIEAWPDGEPDDLRRLSAIASDASVLGRDEVSIEIMELVVDARPDDATALNNLGYALLEAGEPVRAERLILAALEIEPEDPSALDSLGWLRFTQGRVDRDDPEGALALIRRSIELRMEQGRRPSPEVLLHLADASWAAGDRSIALDIWSRLSTVEDPEARTARLAGLRRYQEDVWGAEIVPSERIGDLLDGRWANLARARLEAIDAGRPPWPVDAAGDRQPMPVP